MHPILDRQLRKLGITQPDAPPLPKAWLALLKRISKTYEDADRDRYLVERSLEVSSREMLNLNAELLLAERRAAAERDELRVSEEMLRNLAESIQQVFWVTRPGPQPFLYVSPAFEAIWGCPVDDVMRDRSIWFSTIHPDDQARVRLAAAKGEELGSYDESYRILRPDGQERWIRDRAYPVRGADGQVERIYGVAEDITERRRAEEGLRLSEVHLRQAQKMEAIGRLAGGVAHDFNNLLTVILGYGGLLQADLDPGSEHAHPVSQIVVAGERAKALTAQLLAFSRRQAAQSEPHDPAETIRGMVPMLERLLGEDVRLIATLPPGLGCVDVDKGQFEQVVLNLVVNARDAMPEGGQLCVEISGVEFDVHAAISHPGAHPGPYVCLAVTDTGTGMDEVVKAQLFEPFFTTKGPEQGTGLGLATVYGIVQQAEGFISVASEVGHGACFRVHLPRVAGAVPAAPSPRLAAADVRGTETILLVEDEAAVRALAKTALERHGYTVLVAGHAGEAILRSERYAGPIHLLLTDVVMPEMGGPELAQELLRRKPDLAVAFMSGFARVSATGQAILDDGHTFIQKPFTPTSLAAAVRATLDTVEADRMQTGPRMRAS